VEKKKKTKKKTAPKAVKVVTGKVRHINDGSKPLKSLKHEYFCQLYSVSLNGSEAYREAGYKTANANKCASKLLTKVDIKLRIAYLRKKHLDRIGVMADKLYRRMIMYSESNISDFYEFVEVNVTTYFKDGSKEVEPIQQLRIREDLPREMWACVKGIKLNKAGISLDLYDAMMATKMLGDGCGAFEEDSANAGRRMQESKRDHAMKVLGPDYLKQQDRVK